MKNADITISSAFSGQDPITIKTKGSVSEKNGRLLIVYHDQDSRCAKTTVLAERNRAVISRSHPAESRMVIEPNKLYECVYSTEFASIPVKIKGEYANCSSDADGGRIELCYKIMNLDEHEIDAQITIDFILKS